MTLDVDLADCFTERGLDEGDTALPALAVDGHPGHLGAVEREVRVDERLRQERRRRADDLQSQPRLPVLEPILGEERAETLEEARLVDVDLLDDARLAGATASRQGARSTPVSWTTASHDIRL